MFDKNFAKPKHLHQNTMPNLHYVDKDLLSDLQLLVLVIHVDFQNANNVQYKALEEHHITKLIRVQMVLAMF